MVTCSNGEGSLSVTWFVGNILFSGRSIVARLEEARAAHFFTLGKELVLITRCVSEGFS